MHSSGSAAGLGVSPGLGRGELQVDVDEALDAMDAGRAVVLALEMSSPAEVVAMVRAAGIVAVLDGGASHTAVVARSAGVPAVVGVEGVRVVADGLRVGDVRVAVGAPMTVDGSAGLVTWEQS
jgi:pyruvate,orthophosphate dikinase